MVIKIGITAKLMTTAIVAAVGFIALSAIGLAQLHKTMVDDRIAKVRNVSEIGLDVLKSYYARAQAGEFDQATAQRRAIETLRPLRFDTTEYYFVYSADGTSMLLPPKPEREGKNFIDLKDSNGVLIVKSMLDLAKAGGGALFYQFPRAGSDKPVDKASFMLMFQPWGWGIGTGIYIDDVDSQFRAAAISYIGISLVVMAVVVAVVVFLSRQIGGGAIRLVSVAERLAANDFDVAVPETGRSDEIGHLARAIGVLRDGAAEAARLRSEQERMKTQAETDRRAALLTVADGFEGSVLKVAENITAAAVQLESAAQQVNGSVDSASAQATSVASAAEQASSNVTTVASAAEELSASIREISRQVQSSSTISREAVAEAERTNQLVEGLSSAVGRIGEVVGLITNIADQTNLLALNATIEAARAGEAGKGFAVVAGEVKSLANQTGRATTEITAQITEVQTATQQAVVAIRSIAETITHINSIASAIAAAVEEQGAATQEIARNVQQAAAGTAQVTSSLGQLTSATGAAGSSAGGMLSATQSLVSEIRTLQTEVDGFLAGIRT